MTAFLYHRSSIISFLSSLIFHIYNEHPARYSEEEQHNQFYKGDQIIIRRVCNRSMIVI